MRNLWQQVDSYRLINSVIGAFFGMLAVLMALWVVAALILGTAELVEMMR